jgi:hypothetical protein
LERFTDCQKWNNTKSKIQISKTIENQLKNGDCFELIDGENLEYKDILIKEII